jgi:gamma-carbonic anhydrase
MIYPYEGKYPEIDSTVFLTDDVVILGDVTLEKNVSVWYGTVIRGDVHSIRIGERSNIQDNCTLHVTWKKHPMVIGADVTIGHGAVLHGCTVQNSCLIGMGAKILDAAVIGSESLIAAGTLVKERFIVPEGSLVAGVPGKVVRALTDEERAGIRESAKNYAFYVNEYRRTGDHLKGLSASEYFKRKQDGTL